MKKALKQRTIQNEENSKTFKYSFEQIKLFNRDYSQNELKNMRTMLRGPDKYKDKDMYNRFHHYLDENSLFFKKQFDFRPHHSTDHAMSELTDEICEVLIIESIFRSND